MKFRHNILVFTSSAIVALISMVGFGFLLIYLYKNSRDFQEITLLLVYLPIVGLPVVIFLFYFFLAISVFLAVKTAQIIKIIFFKN